MQKNLKLMNDNILVRLEDNGGERRSSGGIYLAATVADERVVWGMVVAVGQGRLLDNGQRVVMSVDVGDTVCFPKFNSTEITVDGEKLYVLQEYSVTAFYSAV